MKKGAARLILALALVFLFTGISAIGNIYPPKPNAYFHGDANGDTGVTGTDLIQHYNYILSKAYTYDTLQPNNPAQAWNTCDINSDRGCSGTDTIVMNSYILSKSVSIVDDPWSVNNVDLPLTGNAANTLIPFTIDLHSTFTALPSGRAGITVVVEIDPVLSVGTGYVSGRECNPVAGTRDQSAAALAQCALSVAQTNWPVSTAVGLTESGTYGLGVYGNGDGDLNLLVYTTATPGLDVPATSVRLIVGFEAVAESVALNCPYSADEDASFSCTITDIGGSPCAIGPATTCTGVTITGCIQVDIAAQGEAAPANCTVAVTKGSASDSEIVAINEVNVNPVITSTCATTATEGVLYTCNLTATDADLPAQTLTWSLSGDTCGGTITGSTYNWTPTEAQGGAGTCVVGVQVADNFATPGTDTQSTTVTPAEVNVAPVWNVLPSDISIAGSATYNQTNGYATDADLPAQTLACAKVGSDTCAGFDVTVSGSGGGAVNCNLSFTAGAYYQQCGVDVQVSDGAGGVITDTVNITVNGTKNWTIMVYLDGDNNLETYSISDFNEMEKGIANAIASGNQDIQYSMNVIVMIDRITGYNDSPTELAGSNWTDTRLYHVLPDSTTTDPYFRSERLDDGGVGAGHMANLGERNMGDTAQLNWFINYSKTNFPAAHYSLIIWNHGGGAQARDDSPISSSIKAVAWDDTSSDTLYLDEVQQAVSANFNSSNKLSALYFDACLMGMTEVAYEFRNLAEFMVASMHFGWAGTGAFGEYYYLFSNLTGTNDESVIIPRDLSTLLIDAYKYFIENYGLEFEGATMAVTDLSLISSLATYVNALAVQMNAANKKTELETLRDATVHFYDTDDESISWPFYDLYDFCDRIYNDTTNGFPAALKTAANNVITSLSSAIVFSYGSDGNGQSYYYGPGSSTHRGLSIFISRGNLTYGSPAYTHYAYQWWYTIVDTVALWGAGYPYGRIDFCASDADGVVENWRELFEKWYDPSNIYTPSSY